MAVSDKAIDYILKRDKKGKKPYRQFVQEWHLKDWQMSMWDPISKLKMKT